LPWKSLWIDTYVQTKIRLKTNFQQAVLQDITCFHEIDYSTRKPVRNDRNSNLILIFMKTDMNLIVMWRRIYPKIYLTNILITRGVAILSLLQRRHKLRCFGPAVHGTYEIVTPSRYFALRHKWPPYKTVIGQDKLRQKTKE
jgi:hypothetical protein